VTDFVEVENGAGIARTTCGWPVTKWDRDAVRRYWRDVHSPAISRRAGIFQYRHSPFDPVDPKLFDAVPGIELTAPAETQIQWQSDVVYLDEAALAEFLSSPADPAVTALLLGDIELLVDKSTTYKALGENLHTYLDRTGDPTPQGPPQKPRYGLFFRARSGEEEFRDCLRGLAQRWTETRGVLRVRMNLFEVPDMEAERKAGYPVKTHPLELQYQAWIDLVVEDDASAAKLLADDGGLDVADHVSVVHAYPVPMIYTFVFAGRPTLPGLRGYAAYESITAFGAENQEDRRILEWMYGPVVHGGHGGA
jgi:hypothetical protein